VGVGVEGVSGSVGFSRDYKVMKTIDACDGCRSSLVWESCLAWGRRVRAPSIDGNLCEVCGVLRVPNCMGEYDIGPEGCLNVRETLWEHDA
jgi:hypothetical protein